MADGEIRVRYSGLIVFAAQMISVATGLAFTLLLTRNISDQGWSDWSFVYVAIGPFLFASGLFPFWTTRFAARKKANTIKTGIVANLILGVTAAAVYAVFVPLYFSTFPVEKNLLDIFLLASLLVLASYLVIMLESCLRSVKPQTTGYGLLIQEIIKVGIAYGIFFLIVQNNPVPATVNPHGLFIGTMSGLLVATFAQSGYYLWLLRDYFKEKVDFGYLKEWLKGSAVFVYSAVGGQIASVQFYLIYAVNSVSLGDYNAAGMFTNVVGYAASLAFALYPKLLSNNCNDKHVSTSFSTMMMMAIPLAGIAIAMSKSLLTVLNPIYVDAWMIMIILIISTVISMVSTFYANYLMGAENFDIAGKISLRQLVKSKIFKVHSLNYIQSGITVPLTALSLYYLPTSSAIMVATYIAVISIISHIVNLIVTYWLVHKYAGKIFVNVMEVSKYLAVGVVMGAILYLLPETTTLILTLLKGGLGVGIFFGLLLLIDAQARNLMKLIITELKLILGFKPRSPEPPECSVES